MLIFKALSENDPNSGTIKLTSVYPPPCSDGHQPSPVTPPGRRCPVEAVPAHQTKRSSPFVAQRDFHGGPENCICFCILRGLPKIKMKQLICIILLLDIVDQQKINLREHFCISNYR